MSHSNTSLSSNHAPDEHDQTIPIAIRVDYVRIFKDNYVWIASCKQHDGVVIFDPGSAKEILAYLDRTQQKIACVFVTHGHWDHITDLKKIASKTHLWVNSNAIRVVGPESIEGVTQGAFDGQSVAMWPDGNIKAEVFSTPGHMPEHLCYFLAQQYEVESTQPVFDKAPVHSRPLLFCGDVLFSIGCGRIFKGTAKELFQSLKTLSNLPDKTLVFCSHEYTLANITFAKEVYKQNSTLSDYESAVRAKLKTKEPSIPTTIECENEINPFMRCHSAEIKNSVEQHCGKTHLNTQEIFGELRKWKDNF